MGRQAVEPLEHALEQMMSEFVNQSDLVFLREQVGNQAARGKLGSSTKPESSLVRV